MEKSKIAYAVLFVAVIAIACVFRLKALDARPMHGDEANQASKAWMLLEDGEYRYDPHEHHGPTLYYFMLPILKLAGVEDRSGMTETQLRLLPALFGIATVLLIAAFRRAIGPWAAFWAALFTAVSHAMVYYSRYFIQESLFTFFIVATLYCGWRFFEMRTMRWALLTGLCLGLLHATKETCVVAYASMAGGLLYIRVFAPENDAQPLRKVHIAGLVSAAAAVSVVLFSSFFTHWCGPLDSVLTYATYLGRAEGEGSTALHHHPWYYYFHLLGYYVVASPKPVWTEAMVLVLAVLGAVAVFLRKGKERTRFPRFLAVFALLMTCAYCVIPYKTPWNLLPFYQGLILLAGIGAAALIRVGKWLPVRVLLTVALLAGVGNLGRQTQLGTTIFSADVRNPYVYAHTSTSLVGLAAKIKGIAGTHPDGSEMRIAIVRRNGDYWPLPWYLRAYPHVGYYTDPLFAGAAPDIVVGGAEEFEALEARLGDAYFIAGTSSIRPGVFLYPFVRTEAWEAYMEDRR